MSVYRTIGPLVDVCNFQFYEGVDPGLLFQLTHSNMPPIVFKTDSATATEK